MSVEHTPTSIKITILFFFQTATKNSSITISQPTLLDVSPPELFGITISKGGRLVWSRVGAISLRTHYLRIQGGGELHIGSESCQFDGKAQITLLGKFIFCTRLFLFLQILLCKISLFRNYLKRFRNCEVIF